MASIKCKAILLAVLPIGVCLAQLGPTGGGGGGAGRVGPRGPAGPAPSGTGAVVVNNGVASAVVVSGDGTLNAATGALTVTKTNGSPFSAVAISGSASSLTTGTLPHAQLPPLVSGDIPANTANTSGNAATATALASAPTDCPAGSYTLGINVTGNSQGCTALPSFTLDGYFAAAPAVDPLGAGLSGSVTYTDNGTSGVATGTQTGNVTSFVLAGLKTGKYYLVNFLQDATGGRTFGGAAGVTGLPCFVTAPNTSNIFGGYATSSSNLTVTNSSNNSGYNCFPTGVNPGAAPHSGQFFSWIDPVTLGPLGANSNTTFSGGAVSGAGFAWVQTQASATSNKWCQFVQLSGACSLAQPAFSNLSGSVAAAQMPALTGDVTSGAGSVATTVVQVEGAVIPASASGLKTNSSRQLLAQTAADVVAQFSGCSGIQYLGADGACHNSAGGGGSGGGAGGWSNASPASFTATAIQYAPFSGGGSTSGAAAESAVQSGAPAAATISGLYVYLNGAFGAGASAVITLRDGGSSEALTCTIAAGGTNCHDATHSFNVAQGDLVDWQIAVSGTVTNASPQIIVNYAVGTSNVGVTSVTVTGDGIFDAATPSTAVTTTGTLPLTPITQNANCVFAGPASGSAANPSCRAIVVADEIPLVPNAPSIGSSDTLNCATTPNITTQFVNFTTAPTLPAFTQTTGATLRLHVLLSFTTTGTSSAITFQLGYGATPTVLYLQTASQNVALNATNEVVEAVFTLMATTVGNSGTLNVAGTNAMVGNGSQYNAQAPVTYNTTASSTLKLGMKCASNAQAQQVTFVSGWVERAVY